MNYARNTFHKAAESLRTIGVRAGGGGAKIAEWMREHIISSQKFVIPDAGKMLVGKPFDEFKGAMKLPFPRISLLREIEHDGSRVQQICIASEPQFITGGTAVDFFVADVLDVQGIWAPTRPIGVKIQASAGVELLEIDGAAEEEQELYGPGYQADMHKNGFGALLGISELLVMLSLHNVSTHKVEPPAALNKKRARNGKLPLYDYHVLVIDGEEVYGRESDAESDRRIRSHFRRGHIRRLDDARRIWVRPTFVHGAAPGFVDKDYEVRSSVESFSPEMQR